MKLILLFLLLSSVLSSNFFLFLTSESLNNTIFTNSTLNYKFNDVTFKDTFTCTNGELAMAEYNKSAFLNFTYRGTLLTQEQINIQVGPNEFPLPTLQPMKEVGAFIININCPAFPTNDDYFNLMSVQITTDTVYRFSLLISCDKDNRHKKFEFGYVILAVINAAIIVGVALNSRIYSIQWQGNSVRVELTWLRYLFITLTVVILGLMLYFVAVDAMKPAFVALRYFGCGVALPFIFICFNEVFYLLLPTKKELIWKLRRCDLVSLGGTLILGGCSFYFQNWILFNVLAVCVCVGCIKLFYFRSLMQAYASMTISVGSVSIAAIVMHYTLSRSYNDYASQLSSPLFLMVPDLIDNLYKKCSWLPVLDVIVPGVCLSFLRSYDENLNSTWGGVYTIIGNLSFIISTMIWILIEKLYPFSVPFCLVTYTGLGVCIFITAVKRNQHKTLWYGRFLLLNEPIWKKHPTEIEKNFDTLLGEEALNGAYASEVSAQNS